MILKIRFGYQKPRSSPLKVHASAQFIGAIVALSMLGTLSPSLAYQPNEKGVEGIDCQPMSKANEALAKLQGFQVTWNASYSLYGQSKTLHVESVVEDGVQYQRRGPYMRWTAKRAVLANPLHSDCKRLREEIFDGVRTVVTSFIKYQPEYDPRRYKCTGWVEIPRFVNRKMDCYMLSTAPGDLVKNLRIEMYWFYRTDIKAPLNSTRR
jgi:hypothetical protein